VLGDFGEPPGDFQNIAGGMIGICSCHYCADVCK